MSSLHLVKLCVGIESLDELRAWRAHRAKAGFRAVVPTRQTPKRAEALLQGGSLYWVIKGQILVRQAIEAIDIVEGAAQPCRILLMPDLIETVAQPRRAFQGWRYLLPADAPADLGSGQTDALPADLARELRALGAW